MLLVIVTVVAIPNAQPTQVNAQTEEYKFLRSWGGEGSNIYPADIAISPDGQRLYVADPKYHRVLVINRNDRTYHELSNYGQGYEDGELLTPNGIAVDQQENVYVADSSSCFVKKYSKEGIFLMSFGVNSTTPCFGAWGVAVNASGDIFVALYDTPFEAHQPIIRIYNPSGTIVNEWAGNSDVSFISPTAIAVDNLGYIYFTDTKTDSVRKYSENGNFILSFGSQGKNPGQFWRPQGIAIDSEGYLYVNDTNNHRIEKFTSDGTYISTFGSFGSGNGEFSYPKGIDVDSHGNIYVADTSNARVQKFTRNFGFISSWGDTATSPYYLYNPNGVAVDNDGYIYIADKDNNCIVKYNYDGTYITSWGSVGTGDGQFDRPTGLAIDNNNRWLYVVDSPNQRIQKFSLDGSFIMAWSHAGSGGFAGVIVDNDGNVLATNIQGVSKYSQSGTLLAEWPIHTTYGHKLDQPHGLAIDTEDYIYVTLENSGVIEKYSPDGSFITSWKVADPGEVSQHFLMGVATDSASNIFILEKSDDAVFVYDKDGNFINKLGELGSNPGEFVDPVGIAINQNGDLIINDAGNGRVIEMSTVLQEDFLTGLIINGNFESTPHLDNWTYGGTLPISENYNNIKQTHDIKLGNRDDQISQGEGKAWAYQTIYVRPEWDRPVLSFKYNMFVNDIMDYSDFFVEIQDGIGLNHLATVVRDGYQPCTPGTAPAAGTDLGWRTKTYDLSAYKGQYIRIVFSNRNLWPESWGIWTYVDDVKVIDAGPLPISTGSVGIYLPLVTSGRCDPVPTTGNSVPVRFKKLP